MKLKYLFAGACLFAMAAGTAASAAETLRYAEFGPNRGWRQKLHQWLGEQMKERFDGRIELKTTFGGGLIKSRDVLRGVGAGIADIGTIVGVYTPSQLTNYRVGDIPTGNDDPWVGMSAAYEVATTLPATQNEFKKQGVVYFGNFTSSTVLLACKKPLTELSALSGLKVRANPPHSDVFKKHGAVIVSMPFPEVYQALDKGIIDCAQTYWAAIYAFKHHEVAKNIISLNWSQNMGFGAVMNAKRFESLSPEDQKIMRKLGKDMTNYAAKTIMKGTAFIKSKIAEDGSVKVHNLTPESQATLIQDGLDTAKQFKGDAVVLEAYIAAVKKYESELSENGYPWKKN